MVQEPRLRNGKKDFMTLHEDYYLTFGHCLKGWPAKAAAPSARLAATLAWQQRHACPAQRSTPCPSTRQSWAGSGPLHPASFVNARHNKHPGRKTARCQLTLPVCMLIACVSTSVDLPATPELTTTPILVQAELFRQHNKAGIVPAQVWLMDPEDKMRLQQVLVRDDKLALVRYSVRSLRMK